MNNTTSDMQWTDALKIWMKKIKIIDHKKINKLNVKYCILFAWNHYKEIMNKERKKKIIWISHLSNTAFDKKYSKNII